MSHSGPDNETEIDRFSDREMASRNKRPKEEGKGAKEALSPGGNSPTKTEKAPGDTKLTESNFPGNNKPAALPADVASDNKSDIAPGDKNVGAQHKGKGESETQNSHSVTRKPTQMDAIFNTSAANQDEKSLETEGSSENLLLTATSERAMSSGEFRRRPPTRSGGRNLLDSTFSLSGAQIDDDKKSRPTIRVKNPPGGRSSGIWYS